MAEVAKELEKATKDSECSARISADNFVCLQEYEGDEAMIQRVLAFRQQCDERLAQINNRFKVQFTSAIYKVSRGENDIPSLVGKADIAHKTIGDIHKASIVFYDDKIQNEFLRKKKLESSMSSSLDHGDFFCLPSAENRSFKQCDCRIRSFGALAASDGGAHPAETVYFPV